MAALTVEGQRLDADANHPTLAVFFPESDEHAQLQAVVLHFPAAECWRVTARSAASTLTFVTLVGPPR
ncbi:MAG: hypothetical protein EXR66_02430 [Dehalococcoidia bacterium]|nr:hypothetical protein [Dehalococcoidia bacterium]